MRPILSLLVLPLNPTTMSASSLGQNKDVHLHRHIPNEKDDPGPISESRRDFAKHFASVLTTASFGPLNAADAITPQQASQSNDLYAPSYDALDGGTHAASRGIDEARKRLLKSARGDVLEIGVGTGLNLGCYDFDRCVTSLTLVDVSEGMLSQARARIRSLGIDERSTSISFVRADATSELTSLFGKNRFDTVVDTFSLCVMGNEGARKCLGQMRDVVKESERDGESYA